MLPLLKNHRRAAREIMDEPGIAQAELTEALQGLRRINQASNVVYCIVKPIIALARRERLMRITLADFACGGGDVPVGVAARAQEAGVEIDLTLVDRSEAVLATAAAAARRGGFDCRCIKADLLQESPDFNFDVVTCSLFLHHIPEPDAVVNVLKGIRRSAGRMAIISDLRRSRCGTLIAWSASRVLTRSRVVHYDAPVSAAAAWTVTELTEFARRAEMNGARIHRCWPWRMMLVWENK